MKLIDWKTVPDGVAVMMGKANGEFVCHALDSDVCYVKTTHIATPNMGYKTIRERKAEDLRLAPAEQQPWLVYEPGITVIPEWAECSFKGFSAGIGQHTENYESAIGYVAHYKLGNERGLYKAAWTDNPDEVTQ